MFLNRHWIFIAAFAACVYPSLASTQFILSADGLTVYDSVNNITWLANADLPAVNRFGLPLCTSAAAGLETCVNASGSMDYATAAAWVAAMNAANYLGHGNWQLPTTPLEDGTCGKTGPGGVNNFGFGCTAGALDTIYNGLNLKSPNTAVPIASNTVGPFTNLQPYLYWSSSTAASASSGNATFSFATGWQGANTLPNFLYLLPMIPGKVTGAAAGQTVYDSATDITWLANANIAASNTFGLPICTSPTAPALCVAQDGSMSYASAVQLLANMNTAAYLGQTNWQAPTLDASCPNFTCAGALNPMGDIFYNLLGFIRGTSVATPNASVGPFSNLQPYLYWSCVANTIQSPCETAGPASGFEDSYSFGSGFQGTDILGDNLYVTAYFVGSRTVATGPEIAEVSNAEGESPAIAPNTWVEIDGLNLAPAGDSRAWQATDFIDNTMPTQLDRVSVTVNGRSAYIFYISPTQVNILTPPEALSGGVEVVVNNNGAASAAFTAQAQTLSPSFFVFSGGPYVCATHLDGTLIGPATLYPGASTPAKPGETVVIYANGFGTTNVPVADGSIAQSGTLSPLPVIQIGGANAAVGFAGLISPGEFQFNVTIPSSLGNGDQPISAAYQGQATQAGALLTVHR